MMTKVFIAQPTDKPIPEMDTMVAGRLYSLDAEATAVSMKTPRERGVKWEIPRENSYSTGQGMDFDFELNCFDSEKQLPIYGMFVESGTKKGFTDRVGRVVLNLKRGNNKVIVSGEGYVEAGKFAPQSVKFEPLVLEVDLDQDSVYTVFSTGEIVPGERRHQTEGTGIQPAGNSDAVLFFREYWVAIGLTGLGLVGAYYLGKNKKTET